MDATPHPDLNRVDFVPGGGRDPGLDHRHLPAFRHRYPERRDGDDGDLPGKPADRKTIPKKDHPFRQRMVPAFDTYQWDEGERAREGEDRREPDVAYHGGGRGPRPAAQCRGLHQAVGGVRQGGERRGRESGHPSPDIQSAEAARPETAAALGRVSVADSRRPARPQHHRADRGIPGLRIYRICHRPDTRTDRIGRRLRWNLPAPRYTRQHPVRK